MSTKPLALITGASTGIGYELAKCCAKGGYDLLICADEAAIESAASNLAQLGCNVEAVQADLGTEHGVTQLVNAIGGRPVAALLANAGRGLGDSFLEQDFQEAKKVVDLNVTGTISLIHQVGRQMRERNAGKILIVGSIAGHMPGAFQAVYNGTKAFLDNFAEGLRNELKDTGISVTCLMPGPTDTKFFERAHMENTNVGESDKKDDPAMVARVGFEAMEKGEGSVASGFMNKIQTTFAGIIPDAVLAQMHRKMAQPHTSNRLQ